MSQTMVDLWDCIDRVVPEGMSQISRWSVVGNHKFHSLKTWLSCGTSAETFALSAGPYIIIVPKLVRKTNLTCFWYQFKKGGGKSVLTFRTQDVIDFVFEGLRSQVAPHFFGQHDSPSNLAESTYPQRLTITVCLLDWRIVPVIWVKPNRVSRLDHWAGSYETWGVG